MDNIVTLPPLVKRRIQQGSTLHVARCEGGFIAHTGRQSDYESGEGVTPELALESLEKELQHAETSTRT